MTRAPKALPAARLSRRQLLARGGLATAGTIAAGAALNAAAPALWPESRHIDVNRSYWARVLPPPGAALSQSIDTDVLVIGGGFTGLSAALHLRTTLPGRRVVLLEAHACGNGASARNGAMLLTSTADRWLTPGDTPALDRRIHELTVENIAALRSLETQHGLDAEIDTGGTVQTVGADGVEPARETAARLADAGLPVEFWDQARVRERLGTSAYAGGLVDRACGQVHPGRLVLLLKTAAVAAGAELFEQTPVVSIEEGAIHTVVTGSGCRVRSPVLVLATNAYSSKIGYLRGAYAPILNYVGITEPLSDAQIAELGWTSRAPFNDDRIAVTYLGLTRDNRIHIGGAPAYRFNDGEPPVEPPAAPIEALRQSLGRLYPALRGTPFDAAWGGAVDCSLDMRPAVGRMGRHGNVYYAIGYSGHGVNLTSLFGRILADLVAGHDERWRWLPYVGRQPPYVPNEPLRWLGIRGVLAGLKTAGL